MSHRPSTTRCRGAAMRHARTASDTAGRDRSAGRGARKVDDPSLMRA
jgi:hypothetical protein